MHLGEGLVLGVEVVVVLGAGPVVVGGACTWARALCWEGLALWGRGVWWWEGLVAGGGYGGRGLHLEVMLARGRGLLWWAGFGGKTPSKGAELTASRGHAHSGQGSCTVGGASP